MELCDAFCNRDCEVKAAGTRETSRSFLITKEIQTIFFQVLVPALTTTGVDTLCVAPLSKPGTVCKENLRQADYTKVTCATFKNMPFFTFGKGLSLVFVEGNGAQPEAVSLKDTVRDSPGFVPVEAFLIDPDYDYIITSCSEMSFISFSNCVDEDKSVLGEKNVQLFRNHLGSGTSFAPNGVTNLCKVLANGTCVPIGN